jgi:pyruvate/2-oxoglutarate dehydrogenase complex dihydrolipoamide dehydrogenase (E3) component
MTSSPPRHDPNPHGRYHLLIVGAGPAGLIAAQTAVSRGARVALIERNLLGGTCLNTGCIPSKTIIRTSRLYREMRERVFGGQVPAGSPWIFRVMDRCGASARGASLRRRGRDGHRRVALVRRALPVPIR